MLAMSSTNRTRRFSAVFMLTPGGGILSQGAQVTARRTYHLCVAAQRRYGTLAEPPAKEHPENQHCARKQAHHAVRPRWLAVLRGSHRVYLFFRLSTHRNNCCVTQAHCSAK